MAKKPSYSNDHELIAVGKITKRQREILQYMVDNDDDLVFERGAGWWYGSNQTSGRTVRTLIRHLCISCDQYGRDNIQHWTINSTGRKTLETGDLYTLKEFYRS